MSQETTTRRSADIARAIASECVGARVRMLNRTITRIYDEMLRHHGIKFSQMNILTLVTLREPIPQTEVGRRLSLEKSTLSRNVARMEASGWLQSIPGEGKTHLLTVTPQGRQLLERVAPDWGKAQEKITSILGEQTKVELLQAADRLWHETSQE